MKKLLFLTGILISSFTLKAQQVKLQDFTGAYKFEKAPFGKIVITDESGALIADAEGVGKGEISATNIADEFREPNYQAIFKFVREESGKVIRLVVEVNGDSFEGKRESVTPDEYAGKYSLEGSPEVPEVSIQIQDGALYIEASIGGSRLVATQVKDSYQMTAATGGVVFKRDEAGKVTGIEVEYAGSTFKGTRK
ncbi:MAG: hypothetical protein LRY55_03675 [Leadbetterella sp.]|nr:hypothetical protein [Leadbetterella sp.]